MSCHPAQGLLLIKRSLMSRVFMQAHTLSSRTPVVICTCI